MPNLSRAPQVIQLAKNLGLETRGDCLTIILAFAQAQVRRIIAEAPIAIDSLDMFRRMVLDKYKLRLEFIRDDSDIDRIVEKYPDFHPELHRRLKYEFIQEDTEGLTLERDEWDPRRFRYLAIVDARGGRAARAYFTAWHEITHLVIYPEQLPFPGFRRSPTETEIQKDPIESVVDHIAGRLAFYSELFGPILNDAIHRYGMSFRAIEAARSAVEPLPSLLATAIGSIVLISQPLLLIVVEVAHKKGEARALRAGQTSFDFVAPAVPQVRAVKVIDNETARRGGLAIRPNMRVPKESVLYRAFDSEIDVDLSAMEDQGWWETRSAGSLPPCKLHVQATRRGRYVYGLVTVAH